MQVQILFVLDKMLSLSRDAFIDPMRTGLEWWLNYAACETVSCRLTAMKASVADVLQWTHRRVVCLQLTDATGDEIIF